MAGQLEGIIVLSADGRPIVHSHFANHIPTYPLLHSDYFATLLSGINAANAHITSHSSASTSISTAADYDDNESRSNRVYFSKDVKPVLWVPGIPDVNPVDLQNQSFDEDEALDEDEDDDLAVGELSMASQLSARIRASKSTSTPAPIEGTDVWNDSSAKSSDAPFSPSAMPTALSATAASRGTAVVNAASEALAEQGAALVNISSGSLRFLSPISRDVDPLVPLTFLRSFISILQEYLVQSTDPAQLTEDVLRDNFDIVYQLFEEILDTDGNILTTEANLLKSLVLPPNWVGKLVKAVGVSGLASAAPPPLISPIPWRRPNSKYTNNELYVDLVETLEGLVSRTGRPISLEVWAKLECTARLSGTPDLSLMFNNPDLVQDESLHACVRSKIWRKEKRLSFVPPDGAFELLACRIGLPHDAESISSTTGVNGKERSNAASITTGTLNGWHKAIPIQLSHAIELRKGAGEACIQIQASTSASGSSMSSNTGSGGTAGRNGQEAAVEEVVVTFGLSPGVISFEASIGGGVANGPLTTEVVPSTATQPDLYGSYIYDPNSKLVKWTIPRLFKHDRPALIKFSWSTSNTAQRPQTSSAITTQYSIPNAGISGLKVAELTLTNPHDHPYRPFKGSRSITRGNLTWRV
ncbi:clathrin adaptor, mu subunit [Testicularia cyperi]|uniref:Clathrin adaptor, mu subunit n=1 Tax=Testicularia cyperi TaxID=1882483 RepID=A0A317XUH3_9BASI|nr:clathrin adaptor, mu subunit [Testicularia cyperi]